MWVASPGVGVVVRMKIIAAAAAATPRTQIGKGFHRRSAGCWNVRRATPAASNGLGKRCGIAVLLEIQMDRSWSGSLEQSSLPIDAVNFPGQLQFLDIGTSVMLSSVMITPGCRSARGGVVPQSREGRGMMGDRTMRSYLVDWVGLRSGITMVMHWIGLLWC